MTINADRLHQVEGLLTDREAGFSAPKQLAKTKTRHKDDCKRAFRNYDMTCPRCRELANGAKARKGWNKDNRYNPHRPFADVYCTCGKSNLWDGHCKACGKVVFTD